MALSRHFPRLTRAQIARAICQRPTDAIYVYASVCFGWHQNGAISLFLHCPNSFESMVTLSTGSKILPWPSSKCPKKRTTRILFHWLCTSVRILSYAFCRFSLIFSIVAANDYFLDHTSRDVRLLVACSIADVFRVYAPNAPYETSDIIKRIFLFFIQQLRGLQDPKDATFKRYFYLLEVHFC